ncbi:hypothetical protein VCRA2123O444_140036 [Vibrio crassostreae]|nr:hypothetical protein VCRA2113O411_100015 [Vibrio crassostreae]CAK1692892.1 hypothetical protein VCRA2118O429_100015 [Vibrio crassostreae]CAK1693095.1 hypothetical protein VCRA2113O412_100015 [Vibrio crassostreae]CAK1693100.1 hypothetical protein VCRA2114O421_100016 [Vibrio crassostreae]CAK1709522.1 hypothetical protein VCRA2113O414_100167 [Vibrio crassostreae]
MMQLDSFKFTAMIVSLKFNLKIAIDTINHLINIFLIVIIE